MSAVASPYGLRPVQLLGGTPFAGAIRSYPLTANAATGFFFGDPVGLGPNGTIVPVTATPVAGTVAGSVVGIFMGAEWQDPVRGFVNAQFFPANGLSGGATKIKFKILDHPDVVMRVQSSGSVPATALGFNVALVPGAGSVATGDSAWAAAAAPAATATFAVKIIGFPDAPNSAPGDAFTDLLVVWNLGTHRYRLAAGL
jgi:hypothetical protein